MDNPVDGDRGPWHVSGVLYENCSCQLLCRAHVSFSQLCDNDPCVGFWGIRVEEGRFGELALGAQDIVVVFESPQVMATENSWKTEIFFDEKVETAERNALETVLSGDAGGPWKILARFFAQRPAIRHVPIHYENDGRHITLRIDGIMQSALDGVENRKTGQIASLNNCLLYTSPSPRDS